ncbi:MAG: hypothetical protein ILP19_04040 [Oscillospiraceae bacterium]|nr:hypothetical protein [Oscillospiraceae bacterium]
MIFDRFFKKPAPKDTPEKSSSLTFDPLAYLADRHKDSEIQGVDLLFPTYELTLRIHTGTTDSANGNYSVQLIFILTHPFFEEELVESCAGLGSSIDAAYQNAAENFDSSVLIPVLTALGCTGDRQITAKIGSDRIKFRVPDITPMIHFGKDNAKGRDFWDKLSEQIPDYLGRKKAYWIKMYSAWTGRGPVTEVRINGALVPDLTDALANMSDKPKNLRSFSYDKQFILLIQKDEYTPAPFTRDEVHRLTYKALDIISDAGEDRSDVLQRIAELGRGALGYELATLIPEIYCARILGCKETASLIAANGNGTTRLACTQLRSYGWMAEAIGKYIAERHPDKDQNLKVLSFSSRYSSVNQALLGGAKLDDLVFGPVMYNVPDDYEII